MDDQNDADEPGGVRAQVEAVPIPVNAFGPADKDGRDVNVAAANDPVVDTAASVIARGEVYNFTYISIARMGQMKQM